MKRFVEYLQELEEGSFDRIAKQIKEFPTSFSVVGTYKVKVIEWVPMPGIKLDAKEMKLMSGDRIVVSAGNKPGRKKIQFTSGAKTAFYADAKVVDNIVRRSK